MQEVAGVALRRQKVKVIKKNHTPGELQGLPLVKSGSTFFVLWVHKAETFILERSAVQQNSTFPNYTHQKKDTENHNRPQHTHLQTHISNETLACPYREYPTQNCVFQR